MTIKVIVFLLAIITISACNDYEQYFSPSENLIISVSRFDDNNGHYNFEDIRRHNLNGKFIQQKNSNKIVINNIQASWIAIKASNLTNPEKNYLLELNRPTLDKVTAYIPNKTGQWTIIETGDRLPFSKRILLHENFLFSISGRILKQYDNPIYLKIHNPVITFSSINLWEDRQFQSINANKSLWMGVFFGTLLSLIVFNFLIYLSIRDNSYLWYVGYLGFILFYLLAISGYSFRYFWPNSPNWANQSTYFSLLISMSMGLGFCRSMFNILLISPFLATIMKWTGIIIALLAFSGLIIGYPFMAKYMSYLGLVVIIIMLHAVITSVRSGYKPAYYAGLGFLFLFAGSLMLILFKLEILPRNIISEYGIQIGVTFEAFLLSFALAYRINYVNEQLKLSNQKVLSTEKLFSRKLIGIQDEERKQTAATLHDSIGQKLLVMKIQLAQIFTRFDVDKNHIKVKSVQGLIHEVINDIRDISHSLHPHQIERLTLKEALDDVVLQSFKDTDFHFSYDFNTIAACLDKKKSLHIYRIVQESINNIIKHSGAKNVEFRSQRINDDHIEMIIKDDGRGIIKQNWFEVGDYTKAYGLSSIKERVNSLGGSVRFSSPNNGGFQTNIIISCNSGNDSHEYQ